jgi:hypothetical protein
MSMNPTTPARRPSPPTVLVALLRRCCGLAATGRLPRQRGSGGQSTVEYALVLLGAAALALLVVSWATGTDVVGRLFDAVFSRILGQAGG